MRYLTAIELSEKWGISSRMITIHCKNGRISGAIKKGKVWLIPIDAQKPVDERKSERNIVTIDENIAKKGTSSVRNKAEIDNLHNAVYAEVIYKHLGLTRDTVRYYEKIGLIEPKRQIENSYRKFASKDVSQLEAIDFYKKRGFTPLDIRNLMKQSNHFDTSTALEKKVVELKQSIYNQQCTLKRLQETKEFYEDVYDMDGKFEMRDFPLYSVLKSFDESADISNYGDTVLGALDGEDILSHTIRAISFDNSGYKGSKACIVKKITGERQDSQGVFLESGRCAYTAGLEDSSFSEKIFFAALKWGNEHGLEHKGIAYSFVRFILLGENRNQWFCEVWIPIK